MVRAQDIDGPVAWYKYIMAYFSLLFFSLGSNYAIYFMDVSEHFEENAPNTRLIRYSTIAYSFIFAPLNAYLARKYSPRYLLFTGVSITASSLALSVFISYYWVFYLFFSIFVAFGVSLERMAILQLVKPYFDEYLEIAMSSVVSACSLGLLLYRPVMLALIETYSWKPSIFLLGILHTNVYVACAVFAYKEQDKKSQMAVVNVQEIAPHLSSASIQSNRRRSIFCDYIPKTFVEVVTVELTDGVYSKPIEISSLQSPEPQVLSDIDDAIAEFIEQEGYRDGPLAVPILLTYLDASQNEKKFSTIEEPRLTAGSSGVGGGRRDSVMMRMMRRRSSAIDIESMMSLNVSEEIDRGRMTHESITVADNNLERIKDRLMHSGVKVCDKTITALVDKRRRISFANDPVISPVNKFRRPSHLQGSKRIETIIEEDEESPTQVKLFNPEVKKVSYETEDTVSEESSIQIPLKYRKRSCSVMSISSHYGQRRKSAADTLLQVIAEAERSRDEDDEEEGGDQWAPLARLRVLIKSYKMIIFTIAITAYWISQSMAMMNQRDYAADYNVIDDNIIFYITQGALFAVQVFSFFIVNIISDIGATTVYAFTALIMSCYSFVMYYHPDIQNYYSVCVFAAMHGGLIKGSCIFESQILNEIKFSNEELKYTSYVIMFKGLGILLGSVIPENLAIEDYTKFAFLLMGCLQLFTCIIMIIPAIHFMKQSSAFGQITYKLAVKFKELSAIYQSQHEDDEVSQSRISQGSENPAYSHRESEVSLPEKKAITKL